MQRALFISVEGIEGAGKTTALRCLQACLEEAGLSCLLTREPGGTPFAERIRALLLHEHVEERILPETELLMMFAARAQHWHHTIEPALQSGQCVITDRFIDASYAYQGAGRGIALSHIELLDQWLLKGHYPNLTFLLDVPSQVGLERAAQRGAQLDRIETEQIDFFNRVRDGYLLRASGDPDRIKVINANQSIAEVTHQIKQIMNEFLTAKSPL